MMFIYTFYCENCDVISCSLGNRTITNEFHTETIYKILTFELSFEFFSKFIHVLVILFRTWSFTIVYIRRSCLVAALKPEPVLSSGITMTTNTASLAVGGVALRSQTAEGKYGMSGCDTQMTHSIIFARGVYL